MRETPAGLGSSICPSRFMPWRVFYRLANSQPHMNPRILRDIEEKHMKVKVTLGQDVAAYADIEMDVPDGTTEKELAAMLHDRFVNEGDEEPVFDEDWSTASSLRIVCAVDQDGNYISQDCAIEPSPFDAGQCLQLWLKGYSGSLQAVIEASVRACLIPELKMETHKGTFTLPGMESIEVEFGVRVGATREEKDLAFFEALAQVGRVDYPSIDGGA